ncbi:MULTISPECIES: pyruvate dehydrogenase (acetyl-transferring) E1 component subunit alpha [unclassified Leifsonia]|uniref:pyruvate dehydrogenase (acetyl-transferring) E1 component subunit alpha n=1 Tax=unclassified Leifsonia TaxID=2663824 RepID=UPI00037C60CC|nr:MULTISPECIES: pyruvate dehydrogenase (acetyl-transferring) E1 component subunit alpha [unclassified Leifsonia]TDP99319.1 pyruvate dehydrogenase E1 component alpha subunit [Leifsonia sp. 115AMFTsu3.1]
MHADAPLRADDLLPGDTPLRLIDQDGSADPSGHAALAPDRVPDQDTLRDGYRRLVLARRLNDQADALVRQGRLAVYPSSHGQEASEIAAAMVLGERDWLFPTYRDTVAVIARGVDPFEAFVLLRGDWHSGYDPNRHRVAPQATPLATQLLHAVGFAHAAGLRGEDTVVLAMCGDGATSEGDFHEALNFAAVFHLPVVFLVQNNGYAISVPLSRQTAAPSLAHKGVGYGMRGRLVDGNDLAALLAVLGEAVEEAREGGGPTLVEAVTYRVKSHTNADDATRYRTSDEVEPWLARDPLVRLRAWLTEQGALTEGDDAEAHAHAERVAADLRTAIMADAEPHPEDLFAHVYATPTPQLREQAEQLAAELRAADAGHAGQPTSQEAAR